MQIPGAALAAQEALLRPFTLLGEGASFDSVLIALLVGLLSLAVLFLWLTTIAGAAMSGLWRVLGVVPRSRGTGVLYLVIAALNYWTPAVLGIWTYLPLSVFMLWRLKRDAPAVSAEMKKLTGRSSS